MSKMVSIKNKGAQELILGDLHLDDPGQPGQKYVRAGITIKPGETCKPMPASIFKCYDVPALAERVASGELELFVDGESKAKVKPPPAAAPKNVAEAMAQGASAPSAISALAPKPPPGPTPSAESEEAAKLEAILGTQPA